eukprot:TRINITY_DN908_c0_g1_i8.p1 TRINITY_DN908_c0_g1~~TRINITY_DN908_c0_g1_i8.p1  ORF type:complete len:497 (+),score=160.78 TRINITY_DN908_c0_g1_i8:157-1647(+)
MLRSLVGSEMCIRDSINAEYGEKRRDAIMAELPEKTRGPLGCKIQRAVVAILDEIQDDVTRRKKFVRMFGMTVTADDTAAKHMRTENVTLGLLQQCCHQVMFELESGVASHSELVTAEWREAMRDKAMYLSIQIQGLFSSYDILSHKHREAGEVLAAGTRHSEEFLKQSAQQHGEFLTTLSEHVASMEQRSQQLRSRMRAVCQSANRTPPEAESTCSADSSPDRSRVTTSQAELVEGAARQLMQVGSSTALVFHSQSPRSPAQQLVQQALYKLRELPAVEGEVEGEVRCEAEQRSDLDPSLRCAGPWANGRIIAAADLVDSIHSAVARLERRQQGISFCLWKQATTSSKQLNAALQLQLQRLLAAASAQLGAAMEGALLHWAEEARLGAVERGEQSRMAAEAVAQSARLAEEARKLKQERALRAEAERIAQLEATKAKLNAALQLQLQRLLAAASAQLGAAMEGALLHWAEEARLGAVERGEQVSQCHGTQPESQL